MKIATYNVNGINGRLPVLLRWLQESSPDVVCLQELKAPREKFPEAPIREAGYGAIWHGQKSWNGVAMLARDVDPVETRRGLPGDSDDIQSRYIEGTVHDLLIGCLYLPNGNPAPGPKFDYKLRWFERLIDHADELLATGAPIVLAGDYNVMPTELDVYKPESWLDDALFRPEVRDAYRRLLAQGWTDALRTLHPSERIYTFWDYFRNAYARNAGLRIDHLLLAPSIARRLKGADVDRNVRGWERASDHAPTWIELTDEPNRPTPRAAAPSMNHSFDLERFVTAQQPVFDTVLNELKAARKQTHWMWFVFPQLRDLGRSSTAKFYGIGSLYEARAYLGHFVLGPRLTLCARTVLESEKNSLLAIFGSPDDLKFRSSMTLFEAAANSEEHRVFGVAIDRFCAGERDERTLRLISPTSAM